MSNSDLRHRRWRGARTPSATSGDVTSVRVAQLVPGSVQESQNVTLSSATCGGSFALAFGRNGGATTALPHNTTADEVAAYLGAATEVCGVRVAKAVTSGGAPAWTVT